MTKTKIFSILGVILIVALLVVIALPKLKKQSAQQNYVTDTSKIESNLQSVIKPLGISFILTQKANDGFKCFVTRLPTIENRKALSRAVCENNNINPYVGVFWKRMELQKIDFQKRIISNFLKNKSKKIGIKLKGKFNCTEVKPTEDVIKMRSIRIRVDCVTTITATTTKIYTTFIYSYPEQVRSLNANPVVVISSTDQTKVKESAEYLYDSLLRIKVVPKKTTSSYFIDKAYADDGDGGDGGDGGGDGGDGGGDGGGDAGGGDDGGAGDSGAGAGEGAGDAAGADTGADTGAAAGADDEGAADTSDEADTNGPTDGDSDGGGGGDSSGNVSGDYYQSIIPGTPNVNNVIIVPNTVSADGATQHTITATASDSAGGTRIGSQHVIINYQGPNAGQYRGYLVWTIDGLTQFWHAGGTSMTVPCSGGGWAGINDTTYTNIVSCSTTIIGDFRRTSFVVTFNPSFTSPTTGNTLSQFAENIDGVYVGWVPFSTFSLGAPSVNVNFGPAVTDTVTTQERETTQVGRRRVESGSWSNIRRTIRGEVIDDDD